MSTSLTLRVQNIVVLPAGATSSSLPVAQVLLLRDVTGRIYSWRIRRSGDLPDVTSQYLLCLQPGDELTVRVSSQKCGPLDTEVQRTIISVELPEALRRLDPSEVSTR